jgi:protoporphyrinogen oxidase
MRAKPSPKIVIIGGGPTGLGAAWHLLELEQENWTLVDSAFQAGGLAASIVDPQGFVWDKGGHVIFSHYDYFDQLLDMLLGDEWVEHMREAWVWIRERFIPYPFQNNIWRLPSDELVYCLNELIAVHRRPPRQINSFEDWIICQFGQGLADVFFTPYNSKVWAYDPSKLDICWMQERVATVDLARIVRNAVRKEDDLGWGPNARFRFPLRGGTGEIWRRLAALIPEKHRIMGNGVVSIRPHDREVQLADGRTLKYDYLISTMALDELVRCLEDCPEIERSLADQLVYSSTNLIGVGLAGTIPDSLRTKCWMYFPEPDIPFYRATVFSNYSPFNVPDPQINWSLLCEISESPDKPVNQSTLSQDVLSALRRAGFLPDDCQIASLWQYRMDHGYPTPFLGRDKVLVPLNAALEDFNIFSRGRFGAWKYEVSNQDHSLMQGVEVVDRLISGLEEQTYRDPAAVNSKRQSARQLNKEVVSRLRASTP